MADSVDETKKTGLTPKRGAYPTPKSEIDKAPPFIPGGCQPADEGEKETPDQSGEATGSPSRSDRKNKR